MLKLQIVAMDEKPGRVLLDSDDDDDDAVKSSNDKVFGQNCSTGSVSKGDDDDDDAFDSSDEVDRQQVWRQFDRYTDNFFRVRVPWGCCVGSFDCSLYA